MYNTTVRQFYFVKKHHFRKSVNRATKDNIKETLTKLTRI